MANAAAAEKTVFTALKVLMRGKKARKVSVDSHLYDDLKLDSLEVAELSVILEDNLGTDPYSEGAEPRTVGEVIAFYKR
jgi:acyl carrier protein